MCIIDIWDANEKDKCNECIADNNCCIKIGISDCVNTDVVYSYYKEIDQ